MMPRIGSWLSVPSSSKAVPLKCWPCVTICWLCWGFSVAAWPHPINCEPGAISCKVVKLRLRMGISATCFALNSVATSARSVLSCGASAGNYTVSDVPPTWNCMGTFAAASAETITSFCSLALNPGASTRTVYTSGIKWVTESFPLSLVVVASDVLLRGSRTVTLAFATAAPCGSVTVPMMLPYTACACAAGVVNRARLIHSITTPAIITCLVIFVSACLFGWVEGWVEGLGRTGAPAVGYFNGKCSGEQEAQTAGVGVQ